MPTALATSRIVVPAKPFSGNSCATARTRSARRLLSGAPRGGVFRRWVAATSPGSLDDSGNDVCGGPGREQLPGRVAERHARRCDARAEAKHFAAQLEALAGGRPQVVDAQVDRAKLAEAVHALRRRLVHVARADRRHDGQARHRVERGTDDTAVPALVRVVADHLGPHLEPALDALGRHAAESQADYAIESDALFEEAAQGGDELGLERWGRRWLHEVLECRRVGRSLRFRAGAPPAPS